MIALALWARLILPWDTGLPVVEVSPMTVGLYDSGAVEVLEYSPCTVTFDASEKLFIFESRVELSIVEAMQE